MLTQEVVELRKEVTGHGTDQLLYLAGKDGGLVSDDRVDIDVYKRQFQSSGVLYPLLGWRLQISLLEIDALNESLYSQNIIDGTVCRLRRRDISCRTNLIGASYGTFLTGQA